MDRPIGGRDSQRDLLCRGEPPNRRGAQTRRGDPKGRRPAFSTIGVTEILMAHNNSSTSHSEGTIYGRLCNVYLSTYRVVLRHLEGSVSCWFCSGSFLSCSPRRLLPVGRVGGVFGLSRPRLPFPCIPSTLHQHVDRHRIVTRQLHDAHGCLIDVGVVQASLLSLFLFCSILFWFILPRSIFICCSYPLF